MTTGINVAETIKATTGRFVRWCAAYHATKKQHGCDSDSPNQIGGCAECNAAANKEADK